MTSDNHLTHWRPSYKNGQRLRRSATIGGTDFPSWLPSDRHDLTVLDVPGEYSLLADQPLGVPYRLTETLFTWQGIGLGGNAMFNGMLFQTNPAEIFDQDCLTGWHSAEMAPYFQRVRQNVPVTNTQHHRSATGGWGSISTS